MDCVPRPTPPLLLLTTLRSALLAGAGLWPLGQSGVWGPIWAALLATPAGKLLIAELLTALLGERLRRSQLAALTPS